jgi:hypothetical protein
MLQWLLRDNGSDGMTTFEHKLRNRASFQKGGIQESGATVLNAP